MKLGPTIRRALGPAEYWVTSIYRRFFIDLSVFASDLANTLTPTTILDVGCGEGQSTEALANAFGGASILGVDVTAHVGRLFRGDAGRVTFVRQEIHDFASEHRHGFDLAVMCDVLHHLPVPERGRFLHDVIACLRPGGWLVLKDWEPRRNLAHLLCYLSDRYLTGDRVHYENREGLRGLLEGGCMLVVVRETGVRPWPNNVALWAQVDDVSSAAAITTSADGFARL
jgi:2-polyprenyl-6-hydroxyphenyl methylase/3-demethylubiquinone-9 3-methyltransferase